MSGVSTAVGRLMTGLGWDEATINRNLVHSVRVHEVTPDTTVEHGAILDRGLIVRVQPGNHTIEEIVRNSTSLTQALQGSPDGKVYYVEYWGRQEPVGVEVAGHTMSTIQAGNIYDHQRIPVGKYLHLNDPSKGPERLLVVITSKARE